ncbi:MAG TPA: TIM barrel protein [Cyclobacteriaceae bacterium]|nr:TIM barrel protein [Cyclobacteriaceae bacterium]
MKRRDFLKNTALTAATMAVAGPAFSNNAFGTHAMRPIGLQLFTLFGALEQDVPGNLKKIADLGYTEIESAFSIKPGFYGMSAKEFAKLTKDLGLNWTSHHVLGTPFVLPPDAKVPDNLKNMPKPKDLTSNAQDLVDQAGEAGVKYLVCSSIDISSGDKVKSSADTLNKAGELASKAKIGFAYHNHDKEFQTIDGMVPYDEFLKLPSNVKMELDLAWASKAGKDPVELFKKNPGRFPLWHVKDFDKDFKTLQPVGKGVIDFKRIFAAADTAGLQHAFVEHDMPPNAFESIAASISYLKTILK